MKLRDSFRETKESLTKALGRLKEAVELFKVEAQNRDFTNFIIVKSKIGTFFQEERSFLIKALQILRIDGIQDKSLKKAEDVILKFDKFIEMQKMQLKEYILIQKN